MNACHFCGCPQGPRVKLKKVPVEKRLIITDIIQEENPQTHLLRIYSKGREETKKEELACLACAAQPHSAEIVEVRDETHLVPSGAKT